MPETQQINVKEYVAEQARIASHYLLTFREFRVPEFAQELRDRLINMIGDGKTVSPGDGEVLEDEGLAIPAFQKIIDGVVDRYRAALQPEEVKASNIVRAETLAIAYHLLENGSRIGLFAKKLFESLLLTKRGDKKEPFPKRLLEDDGLSLEHESRAIVTISEWIQQALAEYSKTRREFAAEIKAKEGKRPNSAGNGEAGEDGDGDGESRERPEDERYTGRVTRVDREFLHVNVDGTTWHILFAEDSPKFSGKPGDLVCVRPPSKKELKSWPAKGPKHRGGFYVGPYQPSTPQGRSKGISSAAK